MSRAFAAHARAHRAARQRWRPAPHGQRGIAMLVAILLVALGTVIAATVAYENAMAARRGTGMFAFENAVQIGEGAEALAAYGLRRLFQTGTDVYPNQGWDKPYGPLQIVPGVTLTASLEDMTGRFNLNKLVIPSTGQPDPLQVLAFTKLLEELQLETKWAGYIVDWIDANDIASIPDGAEDSVYTGQVPPYRTANRYITSISELLALPGFGRDRYLTLAPYVSALPPDAKLNVCTASQQVLDAYLVVPGHSEYGSNPGFASNRRAAGGCEPKAADYARLVQEDATRVLGAGYKAQAGALFLQSSNYFRLNSLIAIGSTEFNLYSLIYFQQGQGGRVLLRSFTPD